jgi:tripeptidyl-peptidase I
VPEKGPTGQAISPPCPALVHYLFPRVLFPPGIFAQLSTETHLTEPHKKGRFAGAQLDHNIPLPTFALSDDMGLAKRILQGAWLATSLASWASARLISPAAPLPSHVKLARAVEKPSEEPIKLSYGLKLKNVDRIETMLREVSDPLSIHYGKHLSKDEIVAIFGPEEEAYEVVMAWLRQEGVDRVAVSKDGLSIEFVTTVDNANRMLHADFNWYEVAGRRKLRTREYAIHDDHVARYIEVVTPGNYFGLSPRRTPLQDLASPTEESLDKRPHHDRSIQDDACKRLFTPACAMQQYGLERAETDPDEDADSRVGFASFLGQSAVPLDLEKFVSMFDLPRPQDFRSVEVNGGVDHQDYKAGVEEGNLDAQMMALGAQSLPITHFVVGGSPYVSPLINRWGERVR